MATFRIYYVERTLAEESGMPIEQAYGRWSGANPEHVTETEWEETYDGRAAPDALDGFFRDHAKDKENVRLVDEDGAPRELGGFEEYDPDRTYIWIEEGKLMEYQGLDEATEGMVSCPMCDGTGEVEEAAAADFLEAFKHE